jgi:Na+-driven multidrug efflux pump
MASAIAAITAQNLGAKKKSGEARIKKTLFYGMGLCLAFGVIVGTLTAIFPNAIFKMFGGGKEAAEVGRLYLRLMSLDYIILPLGVCAFGVVEGFGKTGVTMTISAITSIAVRVSLAYVFAKALNMGLKGIGLSIPTASFFAFLTIWIYILIKRKKSRKKEEATQAMCS